MDVEEWECPACEAIREGGCGSGLIFLECDGKLYRCVVSDIGRLAVVTCEVVTAEAADDELARLNWPNIFPVTGGEK